MSAEFFNGCQRLLSATANGVYQGILITILAGLALRFARTNAATRHAVWFGVLLLVTALIPAHLLLSGRPRPQILAATTRLGSSMMGVPRASSNVGTTSESATGNDSISDLEPSASDVGGIEDASYSSAAVTQGGSSPTEAVFDSRADATATEKFFARLRSAILKPLSWNFETAIRLPNSICGCLVGMWVLAALCRGWLIVRGIGEVRRVKTTCVAANHDLQTLFERLRDSLEARRNVRLGISSTHRTAVLLGFLHPVVLLPVEMDKDGRDGEAEHVLRHELAHLNRRDDWGNLAQQIIQAALFFHPAVWWISARLSLEREIACDDHVLEASGEPRAYALTLANVASRMHHCRHLLAPGVSNNNSQLQQRITMILNTRRNRSPRPARSRVGLLTTATALLAVLAIDAGPRLVLAQSPAAPSAPASPDAAPPAPPALGADIAPAALPPDAPGAESGPRAKPVSPGNDYTVLVSPQPVSAALPPQPRLPILAPVTGVQVHSVDGSGWVPPPAAVSVAQVSDAGPAQEAPESRHRNKNRNLSIEERLDRIERILDDIEAHGGLKGRRHVDEGFSVFGQGVPPNMPGTTAMVPRPDQEKRAVDEAARVEEQAQRVVDASQRAAEAGQRAAEAGQRQVEQAMREIEKLKSKDMERFQEDFRGAQTEGQRRALQALRDARESLGRQMETLNRQIQRLEEDQNRQKRAPKARSADGDEGTKQEDSKSEQK